MSVTQRRWRQRCQIAAVLLTVGCRPTATIVRPPAPTAPPITSARALFDAMHARYAGKIFTTLSFSQHTTLIATTGRETKGVWHEYIELPGRLRIDYAPLNSRSGVLYTSGRIHVFADGKAQPPQAGWNSALTLLGDVYAQSADTTGFQLDSMGFDLNVMRRDTWEGKPAWVVGAPRGDTTTSQFWIDADSLIVRRVTQRDVRAGRAIVTDIHFRRYQVFGGSPIATEIWFYRDGRLYFKEDYFDVVVNPKLPTGLFDPTRWVATQVQKP